MIFEVLLVLGEGSHYFLCGRQGRFQFEKFTMLLQPRQQAAVLHVEWLPYKPSNEAQLDLKTCQKLASQQSLFCGLVGETVLRFWLEKSI